MISGSVGAWADGPFDGDVFGTLEVLEQALPVSLIATFDSDLQTCLWSAKASVVLKQPNLAAFDHIPVRGEDGTIVGILNRSAPLVGDRTVWEVTQRLHESLLISSNSGILSFVECADSKPFRLVLRGYSICGIVTLSDLQKLAVRPVLFYRITHLELLLAEWLRRNCPNDSWLAKLPIGSNRRIEAEWAKKKEDNLAIDRLSCTDFSDKIEAVVACNNEQFCFRSTNLSDDLHEIRWLRNGVCHAGDYAMNPENAKKSAKAARTARALIEEMQRLLSLHRDQ